MRLVTEDYLFVSTKQILEGSTAQRVLEVVRGTEFHKAIAQLPGYAIKDAGQVKTLRQAF